ncbi:coiled-coil domain-containing protein 39-like [Brachionichthys hirsutus]|uniref:coiled-coil domain-containing protein 39-like n=1 Tax=Brachionichthys hirsutus TaxID=412623 RepID=UPI003604C795
MTNVINTVLSEMGWDKRFAIPQINAENKALLEKIHKTEMELARLDNKLASDKDEKEYMTKYLKNVSQELENTEALCRAKESEIEMEKHLTALAEREAAHLSQQTAEMEKDRQCLGDRKNVLENQIFETKQKLEEFRKRMGWDQQRMDDFYNESKQKEDDTMAVMKYDQQDDQRIKSLTLEVEKKTLEANKMREALDQELTAMTSDQLALDKTMESLQQAHLETQQITNQWERTIEQMKQKDAAMQQCMLQQNQTNQNLREKSSAAAEMKHMLQIQRDNNEELERKRSSCSQLVSKLGLDLKEEETNRRRLQDELDSCKAIRDRLSSDVASVTSTISALKKEAEYNERRLKTEDDLIAALREKLEVVTRSVLSEEERVAQMDQLLVEEDRAVKELDIHLHKCREELCSQKESLRLLQTKKRDAAAQASRDESTVANLDGQLRKLEKELLSKQKTTAGQDSQIVSLAKQLSNLQGNVSSDDTQMLDVKIAELTKTLEERRRIAAKLTSSLKESENDIRRLRNEKEKSEAEKRELDGKLDELELLCNAKERELRSLKRENQDKLVEVNAMKIELKRKRDLQSKMVDGKLCLEARKVALQSAFQERESEIKAYKEALRQQVKVAERERHALKTELNKKLSEVDKLKARFEAMMLPMAAPEGEKEPPLAYYNTKATREREELRSRGENLDAKIRKTELENTGLQNIIQMWNASNAAFHASLCAEKKSGREYQEKRKLEEQLRAALQTAKLKRRQVAELQRDLQGRELTAAVPSAQHSGGVTSEEQDEKLTEFKEFNSSINKMLMESAEGQPDLRAVLERYFLEANLSFPSMSSTPASTNTGRRSSSPSALQRPGASSRQPLALNVVEVGLDLPVTAPPLDSSRSSSSSSTSRRSTTRRPGASSRQPLALNVVEVGLDLPVTAPPLDSSRSSSSSSTSRRSTTRRPGASSRQPLALNVVEVGLDLPVTAPPLDSSRSSSSSRRK